jgi:hypothetical protein
MTVLRLRFSTPVLCQRRKELSAFLELEPVIRADAAPRPQ